MNVWCVIIQRYNKNNKTDEREIIKFRKKKFLRIEVVVSQLALIMIELLFE